MKIVTPIAIIGLILIMTTGCAMSPIREHANPVVIETSNNLVVKDSDVKLTVYRPIEVVNRTQQNCLARVILYEAGNQSTTVKKAVANVVINRTKSDIFPDKICEVVTQKSTLPNGKIVCQFSWFCQNGHRKLNKELISNAYNDAMAIAYNVMIEKHPIAVTKALYFRSKHVKGKKGITMGDLVFTNSSH